MWDRSDRTKCTFVQTVGGVESVCGHSSRVVESQIEMNGRVVGNCAGQVSAAVGDEQEGLGTD